MEERLGKAIGTRDHLVNLGVGCLDLENSEVSPQPARGYEQLLVTNGGGSLERNSQPLRRQEELCTLVVETHACRD